MARTHFITPYDPIHWRDEDSPGVESDLVIKFRDFSRAARSAWLTYRDFPVFEWVITFEDDVFISGSFSGKSNQILALTGRVKHLNRFVAWYRTYIPSEYELFFFVEGDWDSLQLTEGITEEDVARFTGY